MKNEINGMVYCHEIDKWVMKEEYNDFIAKQLQQKILDEYGLLNNQDELDLFLMNLRFKNGFTNIWN